LCAFKWDEDKFKYIARPFCFYVNPKDNFLASGNAIKFLTEQNFDFNKVLKDGIHYARIKDESSIKDTCYKEEYLMREDVSNTVEALLKQVEEWIYFSVEKSIIVNAECPLIKKAVRKMILESFSEVGIIVSSS